MTEADNNTRTMKLEESTLQKAMYGSEAVRKLQEKHPRCPECGEKSYLHISGIDSQEYKCRGEGHEFTVKTEEVFSERELKKLLLDHVQETSSLEDIQQIATMIYDAQASHTATPKDERRYSEWLEIEDQQTGSFSEFVKVIRLNSDLELSQHGEEIMVVKNSEEVRK